MRKTRRFQEPFGKNALPPVTDCARRLQDVVVGPCV